MRKGGVSQSDKIKREKWKSVFLAELATNGHKIGKAASKADVSRKTVYEHLKTDKEFRRAVHQLDEAETDDLEHVLKEVAKSGNVPALIFMLKNRRKRYRKAENKDTPSNLPPASIPPITFGPEDAAPKV